MPRLLTSSDWRKLIGKLQSEADDEFTEQVLAELWRDFAGQYPVSTLKAELRVTRCAQRVAAIYAADIMQQILHEVEQPSC